MGIENAESKDTSRRSDESKPESFAVRVGEIPTDCGSDGVRSVGNSAAGDSWVHTFNCPNCGHESDGIGKILERLDKLEKKYLEYVDAHQGRLRARLNESESSKDEFLQESGDLRSGIYELITTSQHCNNCNDV
jgi:hypothetical protein